MTDNNDAVMLEDGVGRAEIWPALGGGVGRYDIRTVDGDWLPIFQPDARRRGVFALGCNVLLPFSNRISGGGFWHDGVFHALAPNIAGNRFPTHGNALDAVWQVADSAARAVRLTLESAGPGPFRYRAELTYTLREGSLCAALAATNLAPISLPFGAGFHPWFLRAPSTCLQFYSAGFWSEREDHLPKAFCPTGSEAAFDFSTAKPLPEGWINSAFTGWDGRARIDWPDRGLAAAVSGSDMLATAIVFSPSADADFFCFEPVSHSVDAHNRTDAGTAPPQVLQPGETLRVDMAIAPKLNI